MTSEAKSKFTVPQDIVRIQNECHPGWLLAGVQEYSQKCPGSRPEARRDDVCGLGALLCCNGL